MANAPVATGLCDRDQVLAANQKEKEMAKRSKLTVKSAIKAGGLPIVNHNGRAIRVRSAIKAGGLPIVNHNMRLATIAG